MICPKCGRSLPNNSPVCPHCRFLFQETASAEEASSYQRIPHRGAKVPASGGNAAFAMQNAAMPQAPSVFSGNVPFSVQAFETNASFPPQSEGSIQEFVPEKQQRPDKFHTPENALGEGSVIPQVPSAFSNEKPPAHADEEENQSFRTQYGTYVKDASSDTEEDAAYHFQKENVFSKMLSGSVKTLPQKLFKGFADPSALQKQMETEKDTATILLVALPILLFSFLFAMFTVHSLSSTLTAKTLASLGYGNASIAKKTSSTLWRIAAGAGGIAALLQLLCMVIGSGIPMLYLFLTQKKKLKLEFILSYCTVSNIPTLAVSVLGTIFSFFFPFGGILLAFLGVVFSTLQSFCLLKKLDSKASFIKLCGICLLVLLLCTVIVSLIGVPEFEQFLVNILTIRIAE